MAFDDENILQDYIARLLTLQDERDEWLGEDDLKKVARDLGLSDADLKHLQSLTEAHRQRGKNFSKFNAWDEAIAEFRQAMVLDPFDVGLIHELAVAHASRWEETHRAEDRDEAARLARRCIDLDPDHQPSYALLTALKQPPQPRDAQAAPQQRRAVLLVAMATVLLIGVGVAVFVTLAPPPNQPESTTKLIDPPLNAPPPVADAPPPSEQQIPVRLLATDPSAGLHLDVQRSLLNRYTASFSYTLHGTLYNEAEELHRLRMKMTLLGEGGAVVHTKYFDALSDHEPYLRPGDVAPIGELVYEEQPPPALQAVELSVDLIEREPAAIDYGTAPLRPLTWEFTQPAALDVAVYERESALRPSFSDRLHFLTLAVHNQGTRSVQHLRLKVTWFDARDEPITSELTYVVSSSGPAMRPDETWVARAIGTFPEGEGAPFARYSVSVTEAE